MKNLGLFLVCTVFCVLGCSGSSKVGSISENSEKLSEAEPIDESDLNAFQSAVQHGDEMTFRYEYGSQVTFFEASRYCYSNGEDALKFVTNDSKSVVSLPVEKIQICDGGSELWTPKSNGRVFLDHVSGGAQKGFYFGGEFFFEAAKATMGSNPVIGSLMLVMTPVGFAVGASVGTVVGGTAGLVGMGINSTDGVRVCRGNLTEKEKTEFLESHLCFKH
ncbi:MAG: hypothetical protein MJZ26_06385 [Fibrobacter sp.]|nr:hypothetical protein [Fibrobacter sp.]